jgi:two-component system sensor histidine kinase RegB
MARGTDNSPPPADQGPLTADTARKNLLQLVQLRWIAAAGQVVTIAVVEWGLRIRLPLAEMAVLVAALLAGNVLTLARLKWPAPVSNLEMFLALTFDALVLTGLLYLSGGTTNPFTSLYLLQVILGAVLLETWAVWAMIAVTFLCFAGLTETYRPLALPPGGPHLFALYVRGALVGFALNAVLLVTFITRINGNLRDRDERLAALRQRAAEEDHIVRMGLLASGAAHELGTPLATLDVILGDWRRMPKLAADPEIAAEIEDMRAEVARCKTIVTGVLLSAGEARGEAAGRSGLRAYLAEVFEEWKARRAPLHAVYQDELGADPLIVADSALKQAISNLLDNAYESSPEGVWMRAGLEGGTLVIRVQDAGPGFAPQMLAEVGKPYHSTKGRPGGGLGLFLVVNVVRKLGGQVAARNCDGLGAEVKIALPLAALAVGRAA